MTAIDQPHNVLADLQHFAETIVGIALAAEIENYRNNVGLTDAQIYSAITGTPEFTAAARMFGAIGLTVTGLTTILDANINGGSASDYAEAFGSLAGGVLGAYAGSVGGVLLVNAIYGAAFTPYGALALALGYLGATIGAMVVSNLVPPFLDALIDLFAGPNHDPLVIDLDGDGIELTALDGSTARFDLDGDGFAEQTGWVSPDDALLAVDLNGNGTIDDISELFGSDTQTGYEELAAYDSNVFVQNIAP